MHLGIGPEYVVVREKVPISETLDRYCVTAEVVSVGTDLSLWKYYADSHRPLLAPAAGAVTW